MKLPHDAKTDIYRTSGAWGRVSLDMLINKSAQSKADQIALVDADDRQEWTGGAARSLTYGELESEVEGTAAAFRELGLEAGTVVGLFAPNTVDTIVAFLGALRAGLIVVPAPLTWRSSEVVPAFDVAGAKAIITADRLEDAPLAEIARNAAIEIFGVRFVLGIGDNLPDGVAPLSMVRESLSDRADNPRDYSADHIATVTWSCSKAGDPIPVPRSHNQWVATGLMHLLEGRIETAATIHSAFAPTGIVGIGAVLVPWLLTGGTLHLHHFRGLGGLINDIAASGVHHAVLPETLVDPVAKGLKEKGVDIPVFSAVWRSGQPDGEVSPRPAEQASIDLTVLDEFAMVASWRGEASLPAPILIGDIVAPRAAPGAPVLVETRLVGRRVRASDNNANLLDGEIAVSGAMVPSCHWPGGRTGSFNTDDAGFVRTGVNARPFVGGTTSARIIGRVHNTVSIGGSVIHLDELDTLLSELSPNGLAAAYTVDDPIMGHRLAAAIVRDAEDGFDLAGISAFLTEKKIGLHKIPVAGGAVNALPIDIDGSINRATLKRKYAASAAKS